MAVFQPAQPDLATLAADEVALPQTSASHASRTFQSPRGSCRLFR